MKHYRTVTLALAIILALAIVGARSAKPAAASPADAPADHTLYSQAVARQSADLGGECAINAVNLIGAWVDAGAPDGGFDFEAQDGHKCAGTFDSDILPLFTTADIWFPGSQACTECHFDNSADSRHEMNLGSYEGLMLGGDVLSEPPGVAIIVPGNWAKSKLRERLRNNRMPPGWEFDIEEGNRNGPTLTVNGGQITAVELIGAWVDAGAPETDPFTFTDAAGAQHQATFDSDILPLFTTADIWFPGSQACTECHFDNSADSRHEMNLGSYDGLMLGGDVLSSPPGVAIVVPGDWANSKLRARLRNNRMPPGWEFDIEEGNRNGPVIIAGVPAESTEATPTSAAVIAPAPTAKPTAAPTAAPTPAPTREETTVAPPWPWALALMSGVGMALGVVVAFIYFNRLRQSDSSTRLTDTFSFVLGIATVVLGAVLLQTATNESLVRTTTIREKIPFVVVATPTAQPGVIFENVEGRIEAWQARIPTDYATMTNPYLPSDSEAIDAGRRLFRDHNCGVCHGVELKGDGEFSEALNPRPVDLTDKALMSLPFMTDTYLYWRISEGGSQTPFLSAMPKWKVKLTEEERWQLVAFIRSQTVEQISDEDQAAIAIIEKAGCFACHRLNNRGGTIGPEWNGIGETAAARVAGMSAEEYIRQSIVEPGAFTVPGYEDKAETMPRDFAQKLAPEEIDIIVAYLLEQDDK